MKRVRLIHWDAAEAAKRAGTLRAAGYTVVAGPFVPEEFKPLKAKPPHAVLIDLTRLPSHGRDVALALREAKPTRRVPLVFLEGEPNRVARVRETLPDAVFSSWRGVRGALKRALARPASKRATVPDRPAGYSGTPLPQKLGIKPGWSVGLFAAPGELARTLGTLPDGARLVREPRSTCDLGLLFVRSRRDLAARLRPVASKAGAGGLWIAWPKKASGVLTDVAEADVRGAGLAAGLVDFKICAIDATWSGLRFARRKAVKRPRRRS